MEDDDRAHAERRDDVLKRMLKMKPKPHEPASKKKKASAPKRRSVKDEEPSSST